jgi:hypothetical protein
MNGVSEMRRHRVVIAVILLLASVVALRGKDEKLKAEDVLSRHLASIGSPEALAAARSRTMGGPAIVVFRLGGHGELRGKCGFVSEQGKLRLGFTFNSLDYPGEQLAFDGNRLTTSFLRPGQRSALAGFIYVHDTMIREGLLGGTMTTAWPLLNLEQRKAKLNYSGQKKIEGRPVHEMKYRPNKGAGDVQFSLYFDAETFRHVGSQYRLVQPASMQTNINESSGQRDVVYQITERFDDFKPVDGLTLPHSYKLTYTLEGPATILQDWTATIDEVTHNSPIEPKLFYIE